MSSKAKSLGVLTHPNVEFVRYDSWSECSTIDISDGTRRVRIVLGGQGLVNLVRAARKAVARRREYAENERHHIGLLEAAIGKDEVLP